ncbi:hypothetical protein [Flammeovirga sp. SubArs3]|uniref:hypothetical protein n=1 Tax=Flammeovirga sp. SubArs3 TaxID=2995316 RepID=UPI00248CF19B|nr:hypothetical protein [Flammeovirga sp. SubArs3]
MFDSSKSRAILIGIGTFLKDDGLQRREHVYKDISQLRDTLTDPQIIGLHEKDIISLVDSEGNTMIKERIAEVANTTEDSLMLFYSGYLIERRGKLILSSPHTTINQCHINGIPLSEIVEIVNESKAKRAFLILDAEYRRCSTFGDDFEALSRKTIEDLKPFGPKKSFVVAELNQTESDKTIAAGLTNLLQTGIEKESEVITLSDLKAYFRNQKGLEETLFISDGADETPISYNKRFSLAKKLRLEIDRCFQEKKYEEALPFLKEGIELFEHDEEFNNLAAFVETLLQADQMFNSQSYSAAKERYQAAYEIRKEKIAYKGIISSLEKIAVDQFDRKDFVGSKGTYSELVQLNQDNPAYQNRIEFCDNELQFSNLVDLGDRAYFDNNFTEAKEHYTKALTFRNDPVVARRKDECEKVLSREQELREEVRNELRQEIEDRLSEQVNTELKAKEADIEESLRSKLKVELMSELLPQAKDEVNQELEVSIWQKTAVWNSIEGYQFYLSMFPNGKYITKANQRIDQLNSIHVTEKLKEQKAPEPKPVAVQKEKSSKEEVSIDRALLMDLRMEPIEDILAKIEESKGVKGELLLWTDTERIQLAKRNESDEIEEIEISNEPVSELDSVMMEAIREVEEEEGMEFDPTNNVEVTEVSEDSFSIEEAQELSTAAQEQNDNEITEVTDEIIESTFDTATPPENNTVATAKSEEELEQLSEEDLWARAESINTKDSYLEYINYSKTADQIAEAYYRINKIDQGETPEVSSNETVTPVTEEFTPVEETSIENTIEEIIEETPAPIEEPTPVAETSSFTDGMSEEELWNAASSINTIDSYKEYLNRTEENSYLADAYSRINTLQNGEEVVQDEPIAETEIESTPIVEDTITSEPIPSVDDFNASSLEDIPTEDDPILTEDTIIDEITTETAPIESFGSDLNGSESSVVEIEKTTTSVEEIIESSENGEIDTDEEDLWNSTCEENTLGAYFNYLNLTTKKTYWKEAKEKISALKNDSQAKEEDDWKKAQEIDTIEGYKAYIRKYPLGNFYAAAMMRLGKLE